MWIRNSLKVLTIALLLIASLLGALFAAYVANGNEYSSARLRQPDWLLIIGIDSRNESDRGLPDALMLKDLTTGKIQSISRTWKKSLLEPSRSLVEKYLGIADCEPFCNVQGVYAYSAQSGDIRTDAIQGVENLRNLIEKEYKLASLAVVAFDLQWANSFLMHIGGVQVNVRDEIKKGGKLIDGRLQKFSGTILTGTQTLKGEDLFWYTRSRYGSNNSARMSRQEELVRALLSQKTTAELAAAGLQASGMLITDLEIGEVTDLLRVLK